MDVNIRSSFVFGNYWNKKRKIKIENSKVEKIEKHNQKIK